MSAAEPRSRFADPLDGHMVNQSRFDEEDRC